VIVPGALDAGLRAPWPLSSALPPLGALATASATARAHARAVLVGWGLSALADDCEMVLAELVANAVAASSAPAGGPAYACGRMPVVRVRIMSDGLRAVIEVYDQAEGVPTPRKAGPTTESGRGLQIVHAVTGGQWGWHPTPGSGKCVWAALPPIGPQRQRQAG
jgi:hypothetical protein